jgi:antitoxin CcdA
MNSRTPAAAKRPASVSIRLDERVRRKERDAWLERNRAAIEAYNERVEREGVFSDGLRTF